MLTLSGNRAYQDAVNFTPKSISGLQLWLDSSAIGAVTSDSAARVSAWADLSGNNYENLTAQSASLDTWTATNLTSKALVADPEGGTRAVRMLESAATGAHQLDGQALAAIGCTAGASYRIRAILSSATRNSAFYYYSSGGTVVSLGSVINLSNGTIAQTYSTGGTTSAETVTSLGNGWYRYEATITPTATKANGYLVFDNASGTTVSYAGDITKYVDVYAPQMRQSHTDPLYIPTTSAAVVSRSAVQFTDANKPLLTRADNLENLFLQSENLTTSWTIGDATPSAGGFRETATTAGHFVAQNVNFVSGQIYTVTVALKGVGRQWAYIRTRSAGGDIYAWFDLTNGVVGTVQAGGASSISPAPDVGAGYYYCTVTGSAITTGTARLVVIASTTADNNSASFLGDITKGLEATRTQIRSSAADSTYLATTTAPMYRGINNRRVLVGTSTTWLDIAYAAGWDVLTGDGSIYIAWQPQAGLDGSTNYHLLSSSTANTRGWYIRQEGSPFKVGALTNQAGAATSGFATNVSVQGSTQVYALIKSGTVGYHFKDGAANGTIATFNNAVSSTPNTLRIGANLSGTQGSQAKIAAILIFNTAHDAATRQKIEAYLRANWIA